MMTLSDVIKVIKGSHITYFNQVVTGIVVRAEQSYPGALFIALPEEKNVTEAVKRAFEGCATCALVQEELPKPFYVFDLDSEQTLLRWDALKETPLCLKVPNTLDALKKILCFWKQKLSLHIVALVGCGEYCIAQQLIVDILSQRYSIRSVQEPRDATDLAIEVMNLNKPGERLVVKIHPEEVVSFCEFAVPEIFVFMNLNLSRDGRKKSLQEKGLMVDDFIERVQASSLSKCVVVLNYEDYSSLSFTQPNRSKVFSYGFSSQADLWVDGVESLGVEGIRLRLHHRNEIVHLRVPLIGHRVVYSVLCAVAVGIIEGLNWQEIVNGLNVSQSQLRLITVQMANGALLLDDTCDSSLESTLAALNLLESLEGNKIFVLGDLSDLDERYKVGFEMIGIRAAEVVSKFVAVGEQARIAASEAAKYGLDEGLIVRLDDIQQAIRWLETKTKSEDLILIKGSRNMQMDKIVTHLEVKA